MSMSNHFIARYLDEDSSKCDKGINRMIAETIQLYNNPTLRYREVLRADVSEYIRTNGTGVEV